MLNDSKKLEYLELVTKHKQRIRYMLMNNGPETDDDNTLIQSCLCFVMSEICMYEHKKQQARERN